MEKDGNFYQNIAFGILPSLCTVPYLLLVMSTFKRKNKSMQLYQPRHPTFFSLGKLCIVREIWVESDPKNALIISYVHV